MSCVLSVDDKINIKANLFYSLFYYIAVLEDNVTTKKFIGAKLQHTLSQ